MKATKAGTLPQGRVGEGPPSRGRSSGGCWWGPAGRATAAPVPRQRERQPSRVLSVSTYMPSRSFPRKSSMSEAGAGMSAQSPTRGWPAAAAALGHIACFFFMTEVHACCAGLCWSRRCSSLSSHARVCQSPPRHALSQVLHAPRCGTGGPVYPRVYAALRLPAPSPQALPLHSPPLGNPKSALCL